MNFVHIVHSNIPFLLKEAQAMIIQEIPLTQIIRLILVYKSVRFVAGMSSIFMNGYVENGITNKPNKNIGHRMFETHLL
jgi:hypothetical protein